MRILPINFYSKNQPKFMADFYDINPKSQLVVIKTDEKPDSGDEFVLEYREDDKDEWQTKEMEKDGDFYSSKLIASMSSLDYKIKSKNNPNANIRGGGHAINVSSLEIQAMQKSRLAHNQPLVQSIKSGKASGKLLYKDELRTADLAKANEPMVYACKSNFFLNTFKNSENTNGLILTGLNEGALAHDSANMRANTLASGSVYVPELIEKLKSLNGKYVEIEIEDGFFDVKEIYKSKVKRKPDIPQIIIPQMKPIDKILTSKEYSSDTVGAKAFNLKKLEEMVEEDKIDVIIPKSIALPYVFAGRLLKENNDGYWKYLPEKSENTMAEITAMMEKEGIKGTTVMVRSAFNGEDLENYSAAGLYKSDQADNCKEELYSAINRVVHSKNEYNARLSRKQYGISDDKIKPTVLIQNRIRPDYAFTLYTKYKDDLMRIEMHAGDVLSEKGYIDPFVFIYNRKTGELKYESIQHLGLNCTFDENMKVVSVDKSDFEDRISEDKERIFPLIKKLAENALVVEKEFGKPQDIEGGLLDDDIYLWQTRNIVN